VIRGCQNSLRYFLVVQVAVDTQHEGEYEKRHAYKQRRQSDHLIVVEVAHRNGIAIRRRVKRVSES